jgi:hypothetical protein
VKHLLKPLDLTLNKVKIGDMIFAYKDGVTDAISEQDKFYARA